MSDINPTIGLTVDQSGFDKANKLFNRLDGNIESAVKKIKKLDNVKIEIHATLSRQSIAKIKDQLTKSLQEAASKIEISPKIKSSIGKTATATATDQLKETIKKATKKQVKKPVKSDDDEDVDSDKKKKATYTGNFGKAFMGLDPNFGAVWKGSKEESPFVRQKRLEDEKEKERIRLLNLNADMERQNNSNAQLEFGGGKALSNDPAEARKIAKERKDRHEQEMKQRKDAIYGVDKTIGAFKYLTGVLFTVIGAMSVAGSYILKNNKEQTNSLNQAASFNMNPSDYYSLQRTSQRLTGGDSAFNPLMSKLRTFQTDPTLTGDLNSPLAIKFQTAMGMNVAGKNGGLLKGDINTTIQSIIDQALKNLNSKEYTQNDSKMKGMAEFINELGGPELWNAIKNLQALGQTSLQAEIEKVNKDITIPNQADSQASFLEANRTALMFQNQMDLFSKNFGEILLPSLTEFNNYISNNKESIEKGLRGFASIFVGLTEMLLGFSSGDKDMSNRGKGRVKFGENIETYKKQGIVGDGYNILSAKNGQGWKNNKLSYNMVDLFFLDDYKQMELASTGASALRERLINQIKKDGVSKEKRESLISEIDKIIESGSGNLNKIGKELSGFVTTGNVANSFTFDKENLVEPELRDRAKSGRPGIGFGGLQVDIPDSNNKLKIGYNPQNPWGSSGGGNTNVTQNINVYGDIASDIPKKLKDEIRGSILRDKNKLETYSPANGSFVTQDV
jgi:hypothetical protein